jgi:YD repeat-containing protein
MKRKFTFFLLIFIFGTTWTQAQVIPPSPISSEFAKYINFEVSLYNGIPEISVPLYTIQLKGLSIPINLSYHASGIKFEQQSGDAGLGWVLNPGYRISRSILGFADENKPMPSDIYNTLTSYQSKLERDQFLSKFVDEDPFFMSEYLDGEFDQFTFSTPNDVGGFIITDRNNKIITTNEACNLNFDYKIGSSACSNVSGITGFKITDDQGIKYSYGEYNPQTTCTLERNSNSNGYSGNAACAWGLTDIVTPMGEEVKFNYVPGIVGGIGSAKNVTIQEASRIYGCSISDVSSSYDFNDYYSTFFPSEIITPNERIIFSRHNDNRLNNIQILSLQNDVIKSINFYYHSGLFNGYFTSVYNLLDSVTISDQNNQQVETFRFDYYSCPPGQYAFAADQFGYCKTGNGAQGAYFHKNFEDDQIYIREEASTPPYPYITPRLLNTIEDKFALREEVSEIPNILSLKRITYPTGGYTEYEYENNNLLEVNPYANRIETAGIRIKKITSSDLRNNEALVRSYKYGISESGYGVASFFVDHTLFVRENLMLDFYHYLPCDGEQFLRREITYSTAMQGDAGITLGQSGFVRYPCVTEYYTSSLSGIGKIVYWFNIGNPYTASSLDNMNEVPLGMYPLSPLYIIKYSSWNKPYISKKDVYDQIGSLVSSEVFEYEQSFNSFAGLKVNQFATVLPNNNPDFPYYTQLDNYELNSYFNYGTYTYEVGKTELKRKLQYKYLNGNTITEEHNYEYSNLLPSKETVIRSTGDKFISYTTYPLDYDIGTSFIDDMKSKGLIGYPIEKVTYLDNGSSLNIISGTINQYKPGGKGLMDTQWNTEHISPINLNSFKFSNRSIGILPPLGSPSLFLPDNKYARKINYSNYDSRGNILEIQKENDIKTSYIWSYDHTYPVVKGENVSYNILNDAVIAAGAIDLETFWNGFNDIATNTTKQSAWKTFNIALRSDTTLANTQVTTYTYSPLIGMTSQTDPNGLTTYYEYDSFGRLKNVRDKDQNILSRSYYHYYLDTSSDSPAPIILSTLSPNPNGLTFGSLSDIQDVAITSNTTWTAATSASWITLIGTGGSSNESIGIRVSKLTMGTRFDYVTLTTTDGSVSIQIGVFQDSEM